MQMVACIAFNAGNSLVSFVAFISIAWYSCSVEGAQGGRAANQCELPFEGRRIAPAGRSALYKKVDDLAC